MAGKSTSAHFVRVLTGWGVSVSLEIHQGESRGDLAVSPRYGIRQGYRTRALASPWARGGKTCHIAFSHIQERSRAAVPHDWDHLFGRCAPLTEPHCTSPAAEAQAGGMHM